MDCSGLLNLVRDRETKEPFGASVGLACKLNAASFRREFSLYPETGTVDGEVGDHWMFAPASTGSEEEIRQMVETARDAYDEVFSEMYLG